MDINKNLSQWPTHFFGKKPRDTATHTETGIILGNQRSANRSCKPINRKFKKHKIHSYFQDKICVVDFAGMQLIRTYNKGVLILLCVTNMYSK